MMAHLSKFKLSGKERLAKAEQVDLPPPTIGNTGAFRPKSAQVDAPKPEPEPVKPEAPATAGQGAAQELPPAPAETPAAAPTAEKPSPPPAVTKAPAVQAGDFLTLRPLLQFAKPVLPRAEKLAAKLKVTVELLVQKVANETTVAEADFAGDDPAPRSGGKAYRGSIRLPRERAERYVSEVDPLEIHDQGTALRPVCLRAFDRAAESVLSEFERKTL